MSDRLALVFSHTVVAACCFFAGWFVSTQAPATIPRWDEWQLYLSWANSTNRFEWVFEHLNEHRYPLGKAVWAAALTASGGQFRLGQFVTVGLLTAASVLLIWTARGIRGRAHFADALFPVLLLHYGHAFNFMMSFQLTFALFVYGLAGWLWTANRLANGGGMGWSVLAGVYGSIVVLSGGFGLLLIPSLLVWVMFTSRRLPRTPAVTLLGFTVAWLAYGVWVVLTTPRPNETTSTTALSPMRFLAGVNEYFSVGLGQWPNCPFLWQRVAGGFIPIVLLAVAVTSLVRVRLNPIRIAILGVLLGTGLTAAAISFSRGLGWSPWYVTTSGAALAVAWLAIATRPTAGWLTAMVGAALGVLVYTANLESGLREGYAARCVYHEIAIDVAEGVPPVFLAGRYGGSIPLSCLDETADLMKACQRSGLPAFSRLASDPAFHLTPVAGVGVPFIFECSEAEFLTAPRVITLPDPPVGAIGVRFRTRNEVLAGWQRVKVLWNDGPTQRSAFAYPLGWPINRFHLAFPLSGRPTRVRLVADSIVQPFTVEAVEWMIGE